MLACFTCFVSFNTCFTWSRFTPWPRRACFATLGDGASRNQSRGICLHSIPHSAHTSAAPGTYCSTTLCVLFQIFPIVFRPRETACGEASVCGSWGGLASFAESSLSSLKGPQAALESAAAVEALRQMLPRPLSLRLHGPRGGGQLLAVRGGAMGVAAG